MFNNNRMDLLETRIRYLESRVEMAFEKAYDVSQAIQDNFMKIPGTPDKWVLKKRGKSND